MAYSLDRIETMEHVLNSMQDNIENLQAALVNYKDKLPQYEALLRYYGSSEYRDDLDAMEQNRLPSNLACGVLTEDAVYNMIFEQKKLLENLLELSLKITQLNY
ncbi:MAG: DUF4298 domain-containing protein [Coriobacteriia bacterium]|nr:DUF4298 domain-containing protein [Coriobacteriia bacterium]